MFCGHKKWSHRSIPRSKCVANFYSWLSCSEIRQRLFGAIWIFKKNIHSLLLVRLQMQKIISFFFSVGFFSVGWWCLSLEKAELLNIGKVLILWKRKSFWTCVHCDLDHECRHEIQHSCGIPWNSAFLCWNSSLSSFLTARTNTEWVQSYSVKCSGEECIVGSIVFSLCWHCGCFGQAALAL